MDVYACILVYKIVLGSSSLVACNVCRCILRSENSPEFTICTSCFPLQIFLMCKMCWVIMLIVECWCYKACNFTIAENQFHLAGINLNFILLLRIWQKLGYFMMHNCVHCTMYSNNGIFLLGYWVTLIYHETAVQMQMQKHNAIKHQPTNQPFAHLKRLCKLWATMSSR